jgi:hypothetical protein
MKKISTFLLLTLLVFFSFEAYFYVTNHKSNVIIRVSNCNPNDTLLMYVLIVEDIDTSNFESEYINPCFFSYNFYYSLPAGKNKVVLLGDNRFAEPLVEIDFNVFLVRFIEIIYNEDGTYECTLRYYAGPSLEI